MTRHTPPPATLFWGVASTRAHGPLRQVAVAVDEAGTLVRVSLNPPDPLPARTHPRAAAATAQIRDYLRGARQTFDLPWALPPDTPPFRRAVLQAAARIPFGATLSYGEVAALAGHPGAARAAGGAMGANPLPLVIPCHRVVAAGRRLGGFTGGTDLKQALLTHEGIALRAPR